jgi:hypothetical protein
MKKKKEKEGEKNWLTFLSQCRLVIVSAAGR